MKGAEAVARSEADVGRIVVPEQNLAEYRQHVQRSRLVMELMWKAKAMSSSQRKARWRTRTSCPLICSRAIHAHAMPVRSTTQSLPAIAAAAHSDKSRRNDGRAVELSRFIPLDRIHPSGHHENLQSCRQTLQGRLPPSRQSYTQGQAQDTGSIVVTRQTQVIAS